MRKILQTKKKKDTINPNNLREKEGQQGWKQKERNQTEETETVREETLEHRHQLKQLNICSRVSVYLYGYSVWRIGWFLPGMRQTHQHDSSTLNTD